MCEERAAFCGGEIWWTPRPGREQGCELPGFHLKMYQTDTNCGLTPSDLNIKGCLIDYGPLKELTVERQLG